MVQGARQPRSCLGHTCCCQASLPVSSDRTPGAVTEELERAAPLQQRHILRAELALLAAQENLGSLLCCPIGSFLPTLTIRAQAKLYGCGAKGSPVALIHPFGSKVWLCLGWQRWTLLCGVARAGWSEQAQGTAMLPCGLCPARPSRWPAISTGAVAPGTGNRARLEIPGQIAISRLWLPWLAQEQLSDVQPALQLGEFMMLVMETLSFSSPPLKLCKSLVNLKELLENKNFLH